MKNTKQIIVLRKFSGLRTGKYASQAAHASMSFLTKKGDIACIMDTVECPHSNAVYRTFFANHDDCFRKHYGAIKHWLSNSFRKIVCYVESEEELRELHQKALDKGLMSHIVEDNGATEFGGVKTVTALAIGPHWDEDFVGLTDQLKLF